MKKPLIIAILLIVGLGVLIFTPASANASIIQPDLSFGSIGYVTHDNAAGGNFDDLSYDLVIDSLGRYVSAGYSYGTYEDMAIWRYLNDGTLDLTFGLGGYNYHHNASGGNRYDMALGVDSAAGGGYLVSGISSITRAGYLRWDMITWKYTDLGVLDTGFAGGAGFLDENGVAGGNGDNYGQDINSLSDGRFVVAGSSHNAAGNEDVVIWRFNSDGTRDSSFDGDGALILGSPTGYDRAMDIALLSDSEYLVFGFSSSSGFYGDLAMWDILGDGSLNSSFGASGVVLDTTGLPGAYQVFSDAEIDQYGNIIALAEAIDTSSNRYGAIFKYDRYGNRITSFGSSGMVLFPLPCDAGSSEVLSLEIDTSGYVISGYCYVSGDHDTLLMRYTFDGTPDLSFNGTGYLIQSYSTTGNLNDRFYSLAIDDQGRYITSGYVKTNPGGNADMAIWRFQNFYQIGGLASNLTATVDGTDISVGSGNGEYGTHTVLIEDSGVPVGEVENDFVIDRDWSGVAGVSDTAGYRSLLNGVDTADGASDLFDLYVPRRSGDEAVGICHNVSSIDEVGPDCSDIAYFDESSSDVSIVDVGGSEFWLIRGISGTGGFSAAALPDTGQNIALLVLLGMGAVLTPLLVLLFRRKV